MLGSSGCGLLSALFGGASGPIEIPIDLVTPPVPVNATEAVANVEGTLCDDPDLESCVVIKAVDEYDDGTVSSPPSLPDEFPVQIPIEDDDGNQIPDPDDPECQCLFDEMAPCIDPMDPTAFPAGCDAWVIDVEQYFLEQQEMLEDVNFATVVPINLADEVGVAGAGDVEEVSFRDVGLSWIDNSLSFNTVPLELYLSMEELDEDADAQALIDNGDVMRIGTIPAQQADTSTITYINFVDADAETAFSDALKNMSFSLVVKAEATLDHDGDPSTPPIPDFQLSSGIENPSYKRKPKGEVQISLVATLVYTVDPSKLIGDARDAYNESGGTDGIFSQLGL